VVDQTFGRTGVRSCTSQKGLCSWGDRYGVSGSNTVEQRSGKRLCAEAGNEPAPAENPPQRRSAHKGHAPHVGAGAM